MTNLAATGGVPGPGRIGRVAIGDLPKRAADMDYILDHAEVRFAPIDDNLHAQADRRAALQKRCIDLIAIDLTGKAAAQDLENFNDLINGQSDVEPDIVLSSGQTEMYPATTMSQPKWRRHSGARASANPESRDSGSGPSDHPGMTTWIGCHDHP